MQPRLSIKAEMKNSFKKGDSRRSRMQRLKGIPKNSHIFNILLTRVHSVIAFNKSDRNSTQINTMKNIKTGE